MSVDESDAGSVAGPLGPSDPGYLDVQVAETAAGLMVCRIVGDLDLGGVARARAGLNQVVASGRPLVVVDLSEVGFCDSAGLNLLLQVRLEAEGAGVDLGLVALSAPVVRVFELTGAAELFRVFPSVAQAEAEIKA